MHLGRRKQSLQMPNVGLRSVRTPDMGERRGGGGGGEGLMGLGCKGFRFGFLGGLRLLWGILGVYIYIHMFIH